MVTRLSGEICHEGETQLGLGSVAHVAFEMSLSCIVVNGLLMDHCQL